MGLTINNPCVGPIATVGDSRHFLDLLNMFIKRILTNPLFGLEDLDIA